MASKGSKGGAGALVYAAPTEQGFAVQTFGDMSRTLVDMEGLTLVRVPHKEAADARSESADDADAPDVA